MRKAASQVGVLPSVMVTSGTALLALCAFLLIFTRVAYAWATQQSVDAYCENNVIKFKATFKNTEPQNSNLGMIVVATDSQTGKSVQMGSVAPGETKHGYIDTGRQNVSNGSVRFDLTWSNGKSGHDSRTVNYSGKQCQSPTPSPTVAPTPTVTPTVAPTASPTSEPTASPTVAPTASPTVAPTAEPTATPTVAPTATATPRTDLTDGRSDGRKDSLDCVPESQHGRKDCNEVKPVVAGVSTDRSLPTTGLEGSIWGVLSLAAVAGGMYAKKLSKKVEGKVIAEYEQNRKVVYAKIQ